MERTVKIEGLELFCYMVLSKNKHPIEALRTMRKHQQDLTWWDTMTNKVEFCKVMRQIQKGEIQI